MDDTEFVDNVIEIIHNVLDTSEPSTDKIVNGLQEFKTRNPTIFLSKLSNNLCKILQDLEHIGYSFDYAPLVFRALVRLHVPHLYTIIANCDLDNNQYKDEAAKYLGINKFKFTLRYGWHDINPDIFRLIKGTIMSYIKDIGGLQEFMMNVLRNTHAYNILHLYMETFTEPVYESVDDFVKDIKFVIESNTPYTDGLEKVLKILRELADRQHLKYQKALVKLADDYGVSEEALKLSLIARQQRLPNILNNLYEKVENNTLLMDMLKSVYVEHGIPLPHNE